MFIEHVNITVANVDRSIDFYSRLFDWDVRWSGHSAKSGNPAAHVGNEQFYVAMFEADRPERFNKNYETVGFNHFGIVVDDLDAMIQRLIDLNVEHGEEQDYDPGRRIYFRDPDGLEVELVQYEVAKT